MAKGRNGILRAMHVERTARLGYGTLLPYGCGCIFDGQKKAVTRRISRLVAHVVTHDIQAFFAFQTGIRVGLEITALVAPQ